MRLGRGSGASGLAGMRARRRESGVLRLRPLLGWRKAELEDVGRAAGLEAADDPSNRSLAYDRTSARALLAQANWLDPVRIAVSARNLADVEAALAWTAEEAWRGRAERAGTALLDRKSVVEGKSVSVSVDLGGRRIIKKKKET